MHLVIAAATEEHVVTIKAEQDVVAPGSVEDIVFVIAEQHVVKSRAVDALDADQRVALRRSAVAAACRQVDDNAGAEIDVAGVVHVRAAIDIVGPVPADEDVVAGTTEQAVGAQSPALSSYYPCGGRRSNRCLRNRR